MVARHDRLVEDLAGRLEPVRRLPRPGLRTALWLAAVAGIGALLASRLAMIGLDGRIERLDLALAALGAVLTAVTAAYAAFATSVPGRSPSWALLPLPFLALWLGASGPGCLRSLVAPVADLPAEHEGVGCLGFLVCVSIPLSLLIVAMLRRACPLRPNLTAALAGLAVAAAAAALLMPFHPDESTVADLLVHLGVIGGVIGLNGLAGGRLLSRAPG
ncbi:NrsF family protein [Methylobacterium aerolatum]|uniref:DUF1109 domain-containing protein n=1 Tax=Methylobacterium aerolatum TaxID=418708 RepID=A0ABU0HWH0_9HYPH|nr:NrsF family protein [Methylobacterium aerolatum]MDQ0446690.1 hypothetical protein [Methylobacterium aerolatum]GJD33657.1 hypothetical protein FMGBMHLM_0549 [Methylobacterium aerolatum]